MKSINSAYFSFTAVRPPSALFSHSAFLKAPPTKPSDWPDTKQPVDPLQSDSRALGVELMLAGDECLQ